MNPCILLLPLNFLLRDPDLFAGNESAFTFRAKSHRIVFIRVFLRYLQLAFLTKWRAAFYRAAPFCFFVNPDRNRADGDRDIEINVYSTFPANVNLSCFRGDGT
jgi:hypothetical protein